MFDAKKATEGLIDWTQREFYKRGKERTVIGISGGKDSTIAAKMLIEALGKDNVIGVQLPCGKQDDIDISDEVFEILGIKKYRFNIFNTVHAWYDELTQYEEFRDIPNAVSTNSPARVRMRALYDLAPMFENCLVANTCNKTEDYLGYSTKFGDNAGDFGTLKDFVVREVKAIGYELGIDKKFIEKTPIDGMCGKTDEENLGFSYEVADRYIRDGICDDKSIVEKIEKLHFANIHKDVVDLEYYKYYI